MMEKSVKKKREKNRVRTRWKRCRRPESKAKMKWMR